MGGTIKKIIPERNYYYIEIEGEKIFINRKFVIANDLFSRKQPTNFKDLTYIMLKEAGIPTPKTVCFYKKTIKEVDLKEKLTTLSCPLVIKDASGSNSKDVFVNIASHAEAEKIILREIGKFYCLIAQEMVFGKEYRILILDNKAIGVLEMIPPRIFGNNKNTVQELIEKKQLRTKSKTPLDEALVRILSEQGETLASIPSEGKEIFLRKNSSLAEGGETKDSTDIINKEIEALCVKTTNVVDKKLAGLDIICEDIARSPREQRFNIIEANRRPDLYIHYNPTYGKTRDVVKDIIKFILHIKKNSQQS